MGEAGGGGNRLREWQHSSRIIRVSRASGGKDRHSKVWTAKGPRDRRVRLSVGTAIQFYDLQDRLGFDQPSKAVEWLIKAASDAISELPSLTSSFPETPRQLSDEKSPALLGANDEQGFDSSAELEMEMDRDPGLVQTQQHQQQFGSNLSKSSACSSTSETSKGSGGLSFSRTEIRVKARERARERAKEKDSSQPESTTSGVQQQQHVQSSSSFTQLLTSGIGNMSNTGVRSSPPPMSYFGNTGLMGGSSSTRGQIIQLGNSSMHQAMMAPFNVGGDQHQQQQELQHFPFVPDHHLLVPAPSTAPGSSNDHYNLNFSISPSPALATFSNNRGTLQSNSLQSLLPHFQRFSSPPLDGSTLPFFLGAAVDNQHHSAAQFPPGLQLCYGDNGGGLSDQKGKGKS